MAGPSPERTVVPSGVFSQSRKRIASLKPLCDVLIQPMEIEMKRFFALMFGFAALPSVAFSEPVELDCSFGLWRGASIIYDESTGHIGFVTATDVQNIPFIETEENLMIAFWFTPDGQQFYSLSFNTLSGEIAYARVGTNEPILRQGHCSRQD